MFPKDFNLKNIPPHKNRAINSPLLEEDNISEVVKKTDKNNKRKNNKYPPSTIKFSIKIGSTNKIISTNKIQKSKDKTIAGR